MVENASEFKRDKDFRSNKDLPARMWVLGGGARARWQGCRYV